MPQNNIYVHSLHSTVIPHQCAYTKRARKWHELLEEMVEGMNRQASLKWCGRSFESGFYVAFVQSFQETWYALMLTLSPLYGLKLRLEWTLLHPTLPSPYDPFWDLSADLGVDLLKSHDICGFAYWASHR